MINGTSNQKITPVIFQGKAREYFGIWIVNLMLSLLTFGIYSAWAKVRKKKYFYNNTLIDHVGFDYHGNPLSILKGRVIAFIFFMAFAFSQNIDPMLYLAFTIILLIALPWLVVRSSIFNARNTSHRGLRFDFVGKVGEAARTFIWMPIMTALTLGLGTPYSSHQKNRFLVTNHQFGLNQFNMQASVKDFYKVYVYLVGGALVLGIIFSSLGFLAAKNIIPTLMAAPPGAASLVQGQPQAEIVSAENEINQILSGSEPDQNTEPAEVPATEDSTITSEDPDQQKADQAKMFETLMQDPKAIFFAIAGVLAYMIFIFSSVGYLQSRIGNLVWNNTTLDQLSFKSNMRARDLIWLYMSNTLVIALTFGLATPWAQVRMSKYRASKLGVVGDVDFDRFVGDKKAEVKATGEEIADFFDIDLGIG